MTKNSVHLTVSQELVLGTYMCTMMISPVIFSFFQNSDFLVFKGLKMQKMIQNYKFQSVMLYI